MSLADVQMATHTLHEVATHAYSLAVGLQNVAPQEQRKGPVKSIQYLLETSNQIEQASRKCQELLGT